jgi:hypothetical protein
MDAKCIALPDTNKEIELQKNKNPQDPRPKNSARGTKHNN